MPYVCPECGRVNPSPYRDGDVEVKCRVCDMIAQYLLKRDVK